MPFISYENKRFGRTALAVISHANQIIAEYAEQGYDLTLRQLYYQFVSRDIIPNNQREYKRLGRIVSEGRRTGLIDWESITDRTRNLETLSTWESPEDVLNAVSEQFRYDRWSDQPTYVEVWFEKDALEGVFERVCNELRVPFFSCRGYTSDSEVWRAAQRFDDAYGRGKECLVLHFGDHDPSGLDMTRDIEDRLELFGQPQMVIHRLALNIDQVHKYKPPPNPAKDSDTRFDGYRRQYGNQSWELDALEPTVLAQLVRVAVMAIVDKDAWDAQIGQEQKTRAELSLIAGQYASVVRRLKK
jgi:hypothetical protein